MSYIVSNEAEEALHTLLADSKVARAEPFVELLRNEVSKMSTSARAAM